MATFDGNTPSKLILSAGEDSQRATAIKATGSPSPIPFKPIDPVPPVYTHVGHAAQYGSGRRNGRFVRMIVLHVTDVDGSALGAAAYDARRPDTVSATAFAGPNGEIVYDVPEQDRAYTTGRWNDESISVEIVGKASWSDAQWRARPQQLNAIVDLLVYWCKTYQLPAIWLSSEEVAAGASKEGSTPVQGFCHGITDHLTANEAAIMLGGSKLKYSHTCVGPTLRAIVINELIPEAARRLSQNTPSEDDEMSNVRFVRHTGYINVFMVGAGPALSVPGELMESYPADTPRIFFKEPNYPALKALCFQAGLDMNNPQELIPGGRTDAF